MADYSTYNVFECADVMFDAMLARVGASTALLRGPHMELWAANESFLQLTGLSSQALRAPLADSLAHFNRTGTKAVLEKAYQTGRQYVRSEVSLDIVPQPAHTSYFNVIYQPIKEKNNAVVGIFVHITDETELLQARQASLQDEFIALASHQLRTPATGVKQYIGMLLDGYVGETTPAQRDFLQKAYDSNDRQLGIINDLLHIAQIDAGKITLNYGRYDMLKLVEEVVAEQQRTIVRRVQHCNIKNKATNTVINVDMQRMRMAIDNFIDNASKYSPEHTTITIMLEQRDNALYIHVSDQGVGIAKKDFAKLFKKFSRIDNPLSIAVGGSGLGLYLAKRIIDVHGGAVRVHSVVGEGTTFTIMLPYAVS